MSYLQRRHPNLEIKLAPGGEIRARAKNSDEPYKVLDPQQGFLGSFTHPGEALRDVGDAGYDILSGIGTGAGAATGGLTVGAATGGVGALAGAAGGGALANAGLEDIRQRIGEALGVNKGDMDFGKVGGAAIAGAATPLLFGSGAAASDIARVAQESGAVPEALAAAQKGAAGRLWSKLPQAAAKVTGVPLDAIEGAMQNWGALKKLDKSAMPVNDLTNQASGDIAAALRTAKQGAWDKYAAHLAGAEGDVGTDAARQVWKDAIGHAKEAASETNTEANRELVDALESEFNRLFTTSKQVATPTTEKVATGLLDAAGNPLTRDVAGSATSTVKGEVGNVSAQAAADLEKTLGELAQAKKVSSSGIAPRFGAGSTLTDKAVASTAMDAKRALGSDLEAVVGPEARAARARYGQLADLQSELEPMLENPTTAYGTLRNLNRNANRAKMELFNSIDKEFGTDTIGKSKLAAAFTHFGNPEITPVAQQGASGISKATLLRGGGALAGGALGEMYGGHDGGVKGLAAGGALAALMGNPAALRLYIGLAQSQLAKKAGQAVGAAATPAATGAWNALGHR